MSSKLRLLSYLVILNIPSQPISNGYKTTIKKMVEDSSCNAVYTSSHKSQSSNLYIRTSLLLNANVIKIPKLNYHAQ